MTRRGPLPVAGILTLLAATCCGCLDRNQIDPTLAERDQARQEARKLRKELEQLRTRLAEREKQVENLLALGDKRLDKLYLVQRVRFGSATGGIHLDKKPGHDGIKVFLEPIDQHGSVIKAPGAVTIQLFELASPEAKNLLAEYRFDLDETAKHWSSGFLAHHYSFPCRWKARLPKHGEITVRVEFLDYLTGKKHTPQQVVKIALPAAPATQPKRK